MLSAFKNGGNTVKGERETCQKYYPLESDSTQTCVGADSFPHWIAFELRRFAVSSLAKRLNIGRNILS